MADSGALRQERYARHRRGDHCLCRPEQCKLAEGVDKTEREGLVTAVAVSRPGCVSDALLAVLATVSFPEGDPRIVLCAVALRLADSLDRAGPSPAMVSQELERILAQLVDEPDRPSDGLDALRARHAARRVDGIVQWAVGQMTASGNGTTEES